MSAYEIVTPENYPEEGIQQLTAVSKYSNGQEVHDWLVSDSPRF